MIRAFLRRGFKMLVKYNELIQQCQHLIHNLSIGRYQAMIELEEERLKIIIEVNTLFQEERQKMETSFQEEVKDTQNLMQKIKSDFERKKQ